MTKTKISNPCVIEILRDWLKINGYDGLINKEYDCSCGDKTLGTCCGILQKESCKAAYQWKDSHFREEKEFPSGIKIRELPV